MNLKTDFPWRKYEKKELMVEYEKLKNSLCTKIIFPIPFSVTGFKCSDSFTQYERMNTPGINKPSTIEYWNKKKDKIKKFGDKMNQNYFIIANYFNHAPSHFPIVTAGKIYRYFGANKVFDPYAGWGDRCLAAMALNIDYIGIEKNKKLKQPYSKIIKTYHSNSNIEIFFDSCENINIKNIKFDFVLTSPPFWKQGKMLERYSDKEIDYQFFMTNSLIPVIQKCIDRNVWVCLYIPIDMYNDLVEVFGKCNKKIKCKFNHRESSLIYCWKNDV